MFSKDYSNVWEVFNSTTFAALEATFKWNFPFVFHTCFLVIVWLVFVKNLFVCLFQLLFFSPSGRSKDKDKTFLHLESLQTISLGILLAKLAKDN